MVYTEKYCVECHRKLSREDRSPEATAFLNACQSTNQNSVGYGQSGCKEDGVCFMSTRDQVMYYEL